MAEIKDRFQAKSGQICEALDRLEGLVVEGLKHGFFDYSIACEIAPRRQAQAHDPGRQELHIHYRRGRNAALTRLDSGDPCDGDAQDANHVGPTSSV